MSKRERRSASKAELRASEDGKALIGHAAVFDRWTQIGDAEWGFQECIRRGAFKDDIEAGADVRCLFNHDMNLVLGRTASKTLRCVEDETGLAYNCEIPDTQLGKDIRILVSRGDISGCSFCFDVTSERVTQEKGEDGKLTMKREILACRLYDIGPVTFPAYEETDVSVRAMADEYRQIKPDETGQKLEDLGRNLCALRIAAHAEFSKSR